MDEDKVPWIIRLVVIAVLLLGFLIGFAVGCNRKEQEFRRDAADRGHAEYYLDENHERDWRWRPATLCTPFEKDE